MRVCFVLKRFVTDRTDDILPHNHWKTVSSFWSDTSSVHAAGSGQTLDKKMATEIH